MYSVNAEQHPLFGISATACGALAKDKARHSALLSPYSFGYASNSPYHLLLFHRAYGEAWCHTSARAIRTLDLGPPRSPTWRRPSTLQLTDRRYLSRHKTWMLRAWRIQTQDALRRCIRSSSSHTTHQDEPSHPRFQPRRLRGRCLLAEAAHRLRRASPLCEAVLY